MTVIDTKKDVSYPHLSHKDAAKIIGVDKSTIYRWEKYRRKESFNHFQVYFIEKKCKNTRVKVPSIQ